VRELGDEDEATRRVVAWLGAALVAQSPPAGVPVEALERRRRAARPRWRLLAGRPALAAAALLLVALGAGAWWFERAGRRAAAPAPVASIAPSEPPIPVEPVTPEAAPPAPGLVAVSDGRLELRSGPVRLLLFLDDEPKPAEDLR
jgi:hypothetical protein